MSLDNSLSTEDQKLLTEWLGECWHEQGLPTGYEHHRNRCLKCNSPLMINQFQKDVPRLDFSDWRVVGRLVEKLFLTAMNAETTPEAVFIRQNLLNAIWDFDQKSAICKAVLAYLKEGGK